VVKQLFYHNCSSFGSDSVSIMIGQYPQHSDYVLKINFVQYITGWKKTRYCSVINTFFSMNSVLKHPVVIRCS
jgi:hypothetical protein